MRTLIAYQSLGRIPDPCRCFGTLTTTLPPIAAATPGADITWMTESSPSPPSLPTLPSLPLLPSSCGDDGRISAVTNVWGGRWDRTSKKQDLIIKINVP